MKTILKPISGLLGLGLLLAACNGNGGDSEGGGTVVTDADIQGTWTLKTMHRKGTETSSMSGQEPVVETIDSLTTFEPGATMEFKADKTFSMNGEDMATGTWSASGDKVTTITTIPFFNISDTAIYVVTLSGKEGTFVDKDNSTKTIIGITVKSDMVTTIKATKQ